MQKLSEESQKRKKIISHLFESISEEGEAAVLEQKRQSSEGIVRDGEIFPRHVQ